MEALRFELFALAYLGLMASFVHHVYLRRNKLKLSEKLHKIAEGSNFHGEALYQAYESDTITTTNDRRMLHRYLHGSELTSDRLRLQKLAIAFAANNQ